MSGMGSVLFRTAFIGLVAAAALPIAAASAATFENSHYYSVSRQYSGGGTAGYFMENAGSTPLYKNVAFARDGGSSHTHPTGALPLRADDQSTLADEMANFTAYCLSPWSTLNLGTTYTPDPLTTAGGAQLGLSDTAVGQLGSLVAHAWTAGLSSSVNAAAFQIVAWEIVSENGGTLDLGDGHFRVTGGNQAARDQAAGWLAELDTGGAWANPVTKGFTLLKWTGRTSSQNLLTVAPVPLPATGLLMLGGFGVLAGVKRRRRAA